jgi:hypothetical protein
MAKFAFVALLFLAIALAVHSQKPGTGPPAIRFENVAKRAGVEFSLENHPTPEKHIIETMPGGVAVFDYNGDGRPDLYFTNGAAVPSLARGRRITTACTGTTADFRSPMSRTRPASRRGATFRVP